MGKKIKILLLNPPGKKLYFRDHYTSCSAKADYYWHPLDLVVQSGILNKEFDVNVLDAQVLRMNPEEALNKIVSISPDVIFFLCGSASIFEDIEFIKKVKKTTNPRLIGSGDVLRFDFEKKLKEYPFIDAIFLDFTTDGIIKYLKGENSEYIISKNGKIDFLDKKSERGEFSYPVPLYNLFPLKKYKLPFGKQVPFVSVLTSYGCPFKCIYCNSGNLGFKLRRIDNLLEELDFITSKLKIFKIFFRDMTFTASKPHVISICKEIKRYKLSWNCYSRPDTLDEEILSLMKEGGCYLVEIGIETGSEEILKKYKPEITLDKIKRIVLLSKKLGIDVIGHFIIGFPEDTEETMKETLRFALSLPLSGISLNLATPRYGSLFREKCIDEKLVSSELLWMDNSSSFSVILNKNLLNIKAYILLKYYFRISFIIDIVKKIKSIKDIQNIFSQGIGIIKNILGK